MRRTLLPLALVIALLCVAAFVQAQYETVPRVDPLGKRLLYTPSAEALELFSLGNRQVVADFLFLWSIQYYAQYKPNSQFLYLDRIYELITDLDPKYRDPYRVGAILMLIEAEGDPELRKASVLKLLDKGIANNPDDFSLASEAAWHCYIQFGDTQNALRYAELAANRPNAPHYIKRLHGHLLAKTIDVEQAIELWERIAREATDDYQKVASRNALYDLYTERDKRMLQRFVDDFRKRFGRCPRDWRELIAAGIVIDGARLRTTPKDPWGEEYRIDAETCAVVAHKKITES